MPQTPAAAPQVESTPLTFDPYDYAFHDDPYPTYRRLREEAPVYRNDDLGFWAISRYDDVLDAFRDSTTFSSANGVSLDPAAYGPHAHHVMSFLAMDDPRHLRMRHLVSQSFTPRMVARMRRRIEELTLDHLEPALAAGRFDWIADVAGKLPMDVISEMLGVPAPDRAELRRLADLVVHREEGVLDVPAPAMEASISLMTYYADLIAQRRKRPADDLPSSLLEAEIVGDRLTDQEVLGFLFLMVVAGNETTTKLLGNALYWGARNPSELAPVLREPGHTSDWVEETLRYDTSSQIIVRTAAADIDLRGRTIANGDKVLLLVASANRDADIFDDPDTFRLGRDSAQKVASFGRGTHFCLGAHLARLEANVVLEEFAARVADVTVDFAGCERVHSTNVRGFAAMPIEVTARA